MKTPLVCGLSLVALAACAPSDDASVRPSEPLPEVSAASHEWSYDGPGGPKRWGALDAEFEACGHHDTQSPIDLTPRLPMEDLPDISPEYAESKVAVRNTGHTIQFDYDVGGTLFVGDEAYELAQFHFHAQSEHTIDGVHTELELHLVHKNAAGKLLVLGVFIQPGAENETLAAAGWNDLPLDEGKRYDDQSRHFDAKKLIPGGPTYRYQGSLTTPPCSEAVSWVVFERPITMSRAQLQRFEQAYDRNFRPTQPLGTRSLQHGE